MIHITTGHVFTYPPAGSISSGSSLYHSLAKQNLTCYDLMKSFESLGDCDLTKRFKICMKGDIFIVYYIIRIFIRIIT